MEENESKDRPSLATLVRQVAEEIDYQPGESQEVVRLARALTDRDLGEWVVDDDAYRLRRFLAQCLPYLSPELDRTLEDLPNQIRELAVEIRFDGSDWGLFADALNRKGIPSYSSGPWDPVDVRDFCQRVLRDLTQFMPEMNVPEKAAARPSGTESAESDLYGTPAPTRPGSQSFPRDRSDEFVNRLDELLNRISQTDYEQHGSLKDFFKWKMQSHWLLCTYLGPAHPYTAEFVSTVGGDNTSREFAAGLGILEALKEDFQSGCIVLEKRQ